MEKRATNCELFSPVMRTNETHKNDRKIDTTVMQHREDGEKENATYVMRAIARNHDAFSFFLNELSAQPQLTKTNKSISVSHFLGSRCVGFILRCKTDEYFIHHKYQIWAMLQIQYGTIEYLDSF